MIEFFFRRPKIVLDCFTYLPELTKLFPLVLAEEKVPNFYKKLPSTVRHNGPIRGTMKLCPGISTLFKSGFIIPCWADIFISTENNMLVWYPEDQAEAHNAKQWGENYLKSYYHLKLISPWKIREKTGVNFVYTNTFWHDDEFKPLVVNGVVEYKYQNTTSVNMLIPKTIFPKEFTIPAGQPLAHVIPMSDKEIVLKLHEVPAPEFHNMWGYTFGLSGQYFRRKKILKDQGL